MFCGFGWLIWSFDSYLRWVLVRVCFRYFVFCFVWVKFIWCVLWLFTIEVFCCKVYVDICFNLVCEGLCLLFCFGDDADTLLKFGFMLDWYWLWLTACLLDLINCVMFGFVFVASLGWCLFMMFSMLVCLVSWGYLFVLDLLCWLIVAWFVLFALALRRKVLVCWCFGFGCGVRILWLFSVFILCGCLGFRGVCFGLWFGGCCVIY